MAHSEQIVFRASTELREKLQRLADSDRVTLAEEIRRLLAESVAAKSA